MSRPVAYLVVFVSSCCTLIIELVAGRILAPFIGVSLYTWTSIIGVVLAGISLGNYLGGRIADRWPQRRTLGVLLVAGGLASLAILPLITIATAIPTGDLAHSGGVVGKVYALSTLGSIVGTFATGFVLVQLLGTRMIVLGVGIVLLLLAAVFGDLLRIGRASAPLVAGVLLVALLVPARNVKAYGCFDDVNVERVDCVQRSVTDGWSQATSTGCLHETPYYCIKVADYTVPADQQAVKELILDHLVHSY